MCEGEHIGSQRFFQESILACGLIEHEDEEELKRVYYTKKYLPYIPDHLRDRFVLTRYLAWLRNREKLLFEDENNNLLYLTAAKRGNKAYCERVKAKLKYLPFDVFRELNRQFGLSESMSHFLFIHLTYPLYDKEGSWEDTQAFNKYMSRLKKIAPDVTIVNKTREATLKGVAHYHVLLFSAHGFPYYKNEGRLWLFHDQYQKIKKAWPHYSYLDVVRNPSGAYKYSLKYISKYVVDSLDSQEDEEQAFIDSTVNKYLEAKRPLTSSEKALMKHLLTLAYSWAHGLRQYSRGRRWLDLIQRLTNSNLDYIPHHVIDSPVWSFLGLFPHIYIGLGFSDKFYRHDEPETNRLREIYGLKRPTPSRNFAQEAS